MVQAGAVAALSTVWLLGVAFPAAAQWPSAGVPGAGTENRRWLPDAPTAKNPPLRHVVDSRDGVKVTMRDGVTLEGRLLLPRLSGGAGACVLMSDGYGRTSSTGASLEVPLYDIAARGYAVLHASLRGSGASEGTNDIYSHYGRDGYDLVEWMARQPWCNGRVGMVGASLLGISQWLTAKEAPPSLKAIVPDVACGDCYNVLWFPGGMLPGPGRAARENFPGAEAEFPSAMAHRNFDAWWRDRVTLAEDHAAIAGRGVAAFITGGFDDYVSPGNLKAFSEYRSAAGGAQAPAGRRLRARLAHRDHPGAAGAVARPLAARRR